MTDEIVTTVAVHTTASPVRRTVSVAENGNGKRIVSVAFDAPPGGDPEAARLFLARMALAPLGDDKGNGDVPEAALAAFGITAGGAVPELGGGDDRGDKATGPPAVNLGRRRLAEPAPAEAEPPPARPTGRIEPSSSLTWERLREAWDAHNGNMSAMARALNAPYGRINRFVMQGRGNGVIPNRPGK